MSIPLKNLSISKAFPDFPVYCPALVPKGPYDAGSVFLVRMPEIPFALANPYRLLHFIVPHIDAGITNRVIIPIFVIHNRNLNRLDMERPDISRFRIFA